MKKRSCLLAVVLMLLLVIPANAFDSRTTNGYAQLSFDETTAKCYTQITSNSNDEISATMKLWEGSRCVATWNGTGTTYLVLNKTTSVTSGKSYKLTVDYSVNGVKKTSITVSDTCP